MKRAGVEFGKAELDAFKAFVGGAGSSILRLLMEKRSTEALAILTDSRSNMEQMRYAQGANDSLASLLVDIGTVASFAGDEDEDRGMAGGDVRDEDEKQVLLDF